MDMFPCDGCAAPCCRHYVIYLDGGDAYRISRTLKVPLADFVELQPSDEADEKWAIQLEPGSPRRYRMHLRRVADPDPAYAKRCQFLISIGERGRCGIYGVRPSACAAYPTSFSGGLVALGGGGEYCPPGAWQLESLDVPVFRLWHRRKRQGAVVYRALIDAWNARIGSSTGALHQGLFYYFLFNSYQELEASAPQLLADTGVDAPAADDINATVGKIVREMGWPA